MGLTRYDEQYGAPEVRKAVNRAVEDGWVISSVKANPKRGESEGLFALYKVGMTASEYVRCAEAYPTRKVRGIDCLCWDLVRGLITLAPPSRQVHLAAML